MYVLRLLRKIVLGIFILIMLTVIYVFTDSVYATHVIQRQISDDPEDWLTINAEPTDPTTILVAGHAPRGVMEPVELTVSAPHGNQVTSVQVSVDSNFNYMTEIKTNPELWNVSGSYVITAYQDLGSLPFFVTTNIEVIGGLVADFLDYQIDGGFVTNIRVEPNSNSLIISIDTKIYDDTSEVFDGVEEGGVLTIELPRKVIEAKIMDTDIDDKFVVLMDGEDTPYEETTGLSVRTITIPFPHGSNEIKIIGSSLDPEFEITLFQKLLNPKNEFPEFVILALLVLLVSVAVIVVLYQKGKFSKLYPKQ